MFSSQFQSFKTGLKKGEYLCSHFPDKRRMTSKVDRTIKGVMGSKIKWVKPKHKIEHQTYLNSRTIYDLSYCPPFGGNARIHTKSYWDEIGELNIKETKWYNRIYRKWVKNKAEKKWEHICDYCGKKLKRKGLAICEKCDRGLIHDYFHSLIKGQGFENMTELERNQEAISDYLKSIPRVIFSTTDYKLYYYLKKMENPNFRYWS